MFTAVVRCRLPGPCAVFWQTAIGSPRPDRGLLWAWRSMAEMRTPRLCRGGPLGPFCSFSILSHHASAAKASSARRQEQRSAPEDGLEAAALLTPLWTCPRLPVAHLVPRLAGGAACNPTATTAAFAAAGHGG